MITFGNPVALPDLNRVQVRNHKHVGGGGGQPRAWVVWVSMLDTNDREVDRASLSVVEGEDDNGTSKDYADRLAGNSAATTLREWIGKRTQQVDDAYATFSAKMAEAGDPALLAEQAMVDVGMIPSGRNPSVS